METAAALMLLVGCNADLTSCVEIPVPTPIYASAAQCDAALPLEMRFAGTADQKLIGTCAAIDRATLERSATVDWAVNRAGDLAVEFGHDGAVVASR